MISQDTCTSNSSDSNESIYGPIYKQTTSTTMAQTAAGASIFIGFATALLCKSSFQDGWAVIHFLQLILILPLIARATSEKVKEFIVSLSFFALSAYSMPLKDIKSVPLINDISFDQPDEYLRMLGWSSGSTIVNNFLLLIILLALLLINLLFCL